MAEEATLAPGRVLGDRYRLQRLVAAGGMATVWRADDVKLERPVAVKVLSETLTADPAYRARFEREARLAAGMIHPNLVKVYDYAAAGPRPYLVMEFVEGPTLAALISDEPAALEPRRLAEQMLGALGHIHAAGVVHRDVKPSNVLVDGDGTAKLTDFGIARPSDATQLTQTGHVIGTLRYMAPEVKEGGEADQRSDLYALGAVLGEVVGVAPDPETAALAEELGARSPDQRPASAAAALGSLPTATATAAVAESATAATAALPPPPSAPAGAAARERSRRRALAVAATIAAAALLLLAILSSAGDGPSQGIRQAGAAQRRGAAAHRKTTTSGSSRPANEKHAPPAQPAPSPPPPEPAPADAKAPKPEKHGKDEKPGKGPHGEGPPGQLKKSGGDEGGGGGEGD